MSKWTSVHSGDVAYIFTFPIWSIEVPEFFSVSVETLIDRPLGEGGNVGAEWNKTCYLFEMAWWISEIILLVL